MSHSNQRLTVTSTASPAPTSESGPVGRRCCLSFPWPFRIANSLFHFLGHLWDSRPLPKDSELDPPSCSIIVLRCASLAVFGHPSRREYLLVTLFDALTAFWVCLFFGRSSCACVLPNRASGPISRCVSVREGLIGRRSRGMKSL